MISNIALGQPGVADSRGAAPTSTADPRREAEAVLTFFEACHLTFVCAMLAGWASGAAGRPPTKPYAGAGTLEAIGGP